MLQYHDAQPQPPFRCSLTSHQAEMNAANAAESKTEALRKAARAVENISATLQSKADTIRQLSQQVGRRMKLQL
jgi:hypothetical protein